MNKLSKIAIILAACLLLVLTAWGFNVYEKHQSSIDASNICQDNDSITKLIVNNVNPFSKMKFIKKRNTDCKILLINNKDEALLSKKPEFCSIVDNSTSSVTMLIYTYVNDMYDRETASKEFHNMVPLMTPYNYCPQYTDNMITLVKIKKRLGL